MDSFDPVRRRSRYSVHLFVHHYTENDIHAALYGYVGADDICVLSVSALLCPVSRQLHINFGRTSSLVFETILFALTLRQFKLHNIKSLRSGDHVSQPILTVLIRDGTWVYAIIFGALCGFKARSYFYRGTVSMLINALMYQIIHTPLAGICYSYVSCGLICSIEDSLTSLVYFRWQLGVLSFAVCHTYTLYHRLLVLYVISGVPHTAESTQCERSEL